MLIERFEWICKQSPKAASFMYENNTKDILLAKQGDKEKFDEIIKKDLPHNETSLF